MSTPPPLDLGPLMRAVHLIASAYLESAAELFEQLAVNGSPIAAPLATGYPSTLDNLKARAARQRLAAYRIEV